MKQTKDSSSFINIGSSSLLMIFIVLTLVTFAVLSFTSAQSDYNLSKRLASRKTSYYEASSTAEKILTQIDQLLEEQALLSGQNKQLYYESVKQIFSNIELHETPISCRTTKDNTQIYFSVSVRDKQELCVVLNLTDYTQSDSFYTINSWKIVSTDSWKANQTIQLLPMED